MAESEIVNRLSALMVGRIPSWSLQDVPEVAGVVAPVPVGVVGVALLNAPRTLLFLSPTKIQGVLHQYARITTADITATYTVTINGQVVAFDASAAGVTTASGIYDGLLAALLLNAVLNVDLGGTLTFFAEENNQGDTILIGWHGPPATVYTSIAATGSGVISGFSELVSFDARAFCTARSARGDGPPDSAHWAAIDATTGVGTAGKISRYDTAGLERLYVFADNMVKDPNAGAGIFPWWYTHIGPSTDEDFPTGD